MKAFENAKWIWLKANEQDDEYAEFAPADFSVDKSRNHLLRISADSNYTVYINGQIAAFGQYADYPHYKVYDEVNIDKYLTDGLNQISIIVWYYGIDSQTYLRGDAGVIFEIEEDGRIILESSEKIPSRLFSKYVSHECRSISGQLGLTYHYDANAEDMRFDFSREVTTISKELNIRPNKKLILRDRLPVKICMQGSFKNRPEDTRLADKMQFAGLYYQYFEVIAKGDKNITSPVTFRNNDGDGIFFIVDIGAENAGFLSFDIDLPENCRIEIAYGEHLVDGRCRTARRNFTAVYDGKAGKNSFTNTFRRFGCRYIQFHVYAHSFTVNYAGLIPTEYPLKHKEYRSGNLLRDTVYKVCQNTLQQCLHEHYEDCPWREQALYVMDSRNQMLSGYYAFGEYEAPRAALKLISEGQRSDGLLSICYPSGRDLPIPSFSTMYFVQMYEYIKYSGDKTLAEECYDKLIRLIETFISKIQPCGLIENFYSDTERYWNFYEWSRGMDGHFGETEKHIEAPINAFFSIALQYMAKISETLSKPDDAEKYSEIAKGINKSLQEHFFNRDVLLFESYDDRERGIYSVLTNSLCMLCGAAEGIDVSNILRILSTNGRDDLGLTVVPNTLSMNSFRFDALLNYDREKYAKVILDEIDRDYFYMLREGATSFWETINGEADFADAGSLCHGWSALPVYYYEILSNN